MQHISKCRLCRQEKPLLNKSHIIPDFMYASLFDKGHKLSKLAPAELIRGNGRIQRPSSGEYESGLLCAECDNEIIGSYETYAQKALYGSAEELADLPESANFRTRDGIIFTHCRNIKYKELKLFLLSILWRASVSSRPFFSEIRLGPYEETMRQMIINGDPGDALTFPIWMMTWLNDRTFAHDGIAQPGINRAERGIRYIFIIAGVTYVFHVSPNNIRQDLLDFILLPTNEIRILHIPEGRMKGLFMQYFRVPSSTATSVNRY